MPNFLAVLLSLLRFLAELVEQRGMLALSPTSEFFLAGLLLLVLKLQLELSVMELLSLLHLILPEPLDLKDIRALINNHSVCSILLLLNI